MEDNYIKSVDPTSPLHGRVAPGDTITAINGNEILDVLDYKFFAYDPDLEVRLRRPDGTEYTLHVRKGEGGDLGLDFESYLMDAPRSCKNTIVATVMSNLGMNKFAEANSLNLVQTKVGDRYVLEEMLKNGYNQIGRAHV